MNKLFYSNKVGFAWGVRTMAFLTLSLLIVANCLLERRTPAASKDAAEGRPQFRQVITDVPSLVMNTGYVFYKIGRGII